MFHSRRRRTEWRRQSLMGVGEIYARFTYRMHNFSEFMKALCGMA